MCLEEVSAEPVVVHPSRMSVLGIQLRPVVPDGRFLGPASGLSGHGVILMLGPPGRGPVSWCARPAPLAPRARGSGTWPTRGRGRPRSARRAAAGRLAGAVLPLGSWRPRPWSTRTAELSPAVRERDLRRHRRGDRGAERRARRVQASPRVPAQVGDRRLDAARAERMIPVRHLASGSSSRLVTSA
jgi:hypothetical protein